VSGAGRRGAWVAAAVVAAALLLVPVFEPEKFTLQFMTRVMVMGLFAMGLDFALGCGGLVSFGHAMFFGTAGYALALMAPGGEGASFWLSLPLAMGVSALLALAVGALALRTGGVYFIMITLAFAQMLYFLVHDTRFAGGSDGLYIYTRPDATLGGFKPFDLDNVQHLYYVVLGCLAAGFALLAWLKATAFGRVIEAIRVNEERMHSLGYAVFRHKLACFTLSGALAGAAGYLGAVQFGVVNADMLGWQMSGTAMMMVILGGMGTLWGAALGAAAMLGAELGFQSLPVLHFAGHDVELGKHWLLWMGVCIVGVALYLPQGLAGLLSRRPRTEPADD